MLCIVDNHSCKMSFEGNLILKGLLMNLFQAEEDDLVRVVKGLLEKEDMQAKNSFMKNNANLKRKNQGRF